MSPEPFVGYDQPEPSYSLELFDLAGQRLGRGDEFRDATGIRFFRSFQEPGEISFSLPKRYEDDAFAWIGYEVRLVRDGDSDNPVFAGLIEDGSITVGDDVLSLRCPGLGALLDDAIVTWEWTGLDTGALAKALLDQFVNADRPWVTATYPGTIATSGYGVPPLPSAGMKLKADKQRPRSILATLATLAGSWDFHVEKVAGVNVLYMQPPPSDVDLYLPAYYLPMKFGMKRSLREIVTGIVAYGGKDSNGNALVAVREDGGAILDYRGRKKWLAVSNNQITTQVDLNRWTDQQLAYRTSQLKQGTLTLPWRYYDHDNRLQVFDPNLFMPNMRIRVIGIDSTNVGLREETVRLSRVAFDFAAGTIAVSYGVRHDFLPKRFDYEIEQLRHGQSDSVNPLFLVHATVPGLRHDFDTDFPTTYTWGGTMIWGVTPWTPSP